MIRARIAVVPLCAALVLSACTAGGLDRTGGAGTTTQLVLASDDGVDLDGVPAVQHFVDRVAELSQGRITVRVQPSWDDAYDEPQLVRDVAAGKADLGWVGTRALGNLDDHAFDPIHAPFLVGDYGAERAVVGDHDLQHTLLSSMDDLGVTGLALISDELRFLASADRPVVDPADIEGLSVRTNRSVAQESALTSLGADPVVGQEVPIAEADADESMWWTYNAHDEQEVMPYVTWGVALWPRTVALFANPRSLSGLPAEQRDWVRQAAREAAEWSLDHDADREARQIGTACAAGARIAVLTDDQVAAWRAAAEPAYSALRADASTSEVMARVEKLVAAATPVDPTPIPSACRYVPGEHDSHPTVPAPRTSPGNPGDLPQGTYRTESTVEDLLAAGLDRHDAELNAGVFTWTLAGGTWHNEQKPAVPARVTVTTCDGFYDVVDGEAVFTTSSTRPNGMCAPPMFGGPWTWDGTTIAWQWPDVLAPYLGAVWTKID